MAVAWIAWRDLEQARQQSAAFRSECTHWIFREWSQPIKRGTAFARRAGWFLESWSEPTTVRLGFLEKILEARGQLPTTRAMSVRDAEQELWRALSEERLMLKGWMRMESRSIFRSAKWSYLKLFEDGNRDFLKYNPLDRGEPYRQVKLKRDDLLTLWPVQSKSVVRMETEIWIEPEMLKPLSDAGSAGYVPLCAALHWIMSEGGTRTVRVNDPAAWKISVGQLWPFLVAGEIELIGLPHSSPSFAERIPGHALVMVKLLVPLDSPIEDILLNSPSHIDCTPYDEEHWVRDFSDRLFETGVANPVWTHLQVPKAAILAHWPRPSAKAKAEQECYRWLLDLMRQSPTKKRNHAESYRQKHRPYFPNWGVINSTAPGSERWRKPKHWLGRNQAECSRQSGSSRTKRNA